ncbi:MAG: sigma-70 family RNA polymerase sigma factor [Phycisphaerae bacterium]
MVPPSKTASETRVVELLKRGDGDAAGELLSLLYHQLRDMAARLLAPAGPQTLQPTALVHEAYLHLVGTAPLSFESRAHFFGVAARSMRQIIVDHARQRGAAKRGGDGHRVTLVDSEFATAGINVDLIALDEAVSKLELLNERHCRVIELRFFAGLSVEESAAALHVSPRTVEMDWRMARAWLFRELNS